MTSNDPGRPLPPDVPAVVALLNSVTAGLGGLYLATRSVTVALIAAAAVPVLAATPVITAATLDRVRHARTSSRRRRAIADPDARN